MNAYSIGYFKIEGIKLIQIYLKTVINDTDFECLAVLTDHSQDVKSLVWHPNTEILLSTSYDDTLRLWREDGDDWYCSDILQGHTSTVWSADFDSTGKWIVSGGDDGLVKFWHQSSNAGTATGGWRNDAKYVNENTLDKSETGISRTIYSLSWSKRLPNLIAIGSGDNAVRLLSVDIPDSTTSPMQAQVIDTVKEPHGYCDVNCVVWNPSERYRRFLASAGDDGVVRIWEVVI